MRKDVTNTKYSEYYKALRINVQFWVLKSIFLGKNANVDFSVVKEVAMLTEPPSFYEGLEAWKGTMT